MILFLLLSYSPSYLVDEIKEAMKILEDEVNPVLKGKMKILPLHSTIPQHDQQQVFVPADANRLNIILSGGSDILW